jgi:two-component system, OmpR family, phosphate regulon sensor histidine kinase PhoR
MIKNATPGVISLLNAAIIGMVSFVLMLLIGHNEWSDALIISVSTSILAYITIRIFLEQFIYRKIKIIYKLIHDQRSGKKDGFSFLPLAKSNPLEQVNDEVISWLFRQNSEIAELKEQENFRKEFLGNVSHELKTPIFNIQGYLDTLLDGAIHDPNVNIAFIKKAAKSADRLNLLVNELLTISQMETGKLQMNMTKFSIGELIADIFESLELRAGLRNVRMLFLEGAQEHFIVMADRDRIRQVLVNLIVNAINYGKEGGQVVLNVFEMEPNILIEVTDDGEGIDQEHLPRLFERFYRIDSSRSRSQGGTGLGLSIVKHIIESHGQNIHVRSTRGIGSTFGFTLQRADVK